MSRSFDATKSGETRDYEYRECGCEGKSNSFAEAKKSYLRTLAKLLAIEILVEEGIINEESSCLLEE